ncbi:hypothetical protein EDF56_11541 [Novosphingobium sp. PhB165]|nr:hypothetical protein EDF56_11541 [Novosphingobium sp. PhB165]
MEDAAPTDLLHVRQDVSCPGPEPQLDFELNFPFLTFNATR